MLKKTKKGISSNDIIVFLIMYFSEDVLMFSTNMNRAFFALKNICVVLITAFMMYRQVKKSIKIFRSVVIIVSIMCVNICVTMVANQDVDNRFFYHLVIIILAVMVSSELSETDFVISYCKCMKLFSIASLIEYVVFLLAYRITLIAPQITNLSGAQFSNWFLAVSLNKEYYFIYPYRNWGIYREPGVYMCFLILALIFQLFYCEWNAINVLIYFSALITTFSTGGYIVAFALLVLYAIESMSVRKIQNRKLIGIIVLSVVVCGCVLYFWEFIDKWVFAKFAQEGGSADSRFGAVLSNLFLFFRKPFLGNGWTNMSVDFSTIQDIIVSNHNTNTFLLLFAVYGLVVGIIMLGGTTSFFIGKNKVFLGVCLALCWIITLSNENLSLNVVVYIIAVYGIKRLRIY